MKLAGLPCMLVLVSGCAWAQDTAGGLNSMPSPLLASIPPQSVPDAGDVVSVQALTHKPNRAAVRAFQAAGKAYGDGDLEQWAAKLREAVRRDPQYAAAVHNLGVYDLITNKFTDAVHQFTQALALDPASAAAHRNLAVALGGLGRYGEAEQHLRRALQLEPGSSRAEFILGVLYVQTGDLTEALRLLRAAAQQIPNAGVLAARIEAVRYSALHANAR